MSRVDSLLFGTNYHESLKVVELFGQCDYMVSIRCDFNCSFIVSILRYFFIVQLVEEVFYIFVICYYHFYQVYFSSVRVFLFLLLRRKHYVILVRIKLKNIK